jgi:hypothetical protein
VDERPKLLDAFSGAGGSARGYQLAGFHVTGIDVRPQPRYAGDVFVQADALEYLAAHGREYDCVHASPPCQAHVQWRSVNLARRGSVPWHPDFVPATLEALESAGRPWVLENVVGAPLRRPLLLCGSMFGLLVRRHRLFASSHLLMQPRPCRHSRDAVAVYGRPDGRLVWTRSDGSKARAARTLAEGSAAMGIDWMEWAELKEAIPPAYTHWVGRQLRRVLEDTPGA